MEPTEIPYPLRTIGGEFDITSDSITTNNLNALSITTTNLTASQSFLGGSANQVHYTGNLGQTAFTGPGSIGQVLTSNGTSAPSFQNVPIPTTAPNISGGTAGSIPVQTAPDTTSFISPGTAGFVLKATGVGGIPVYGASSGGAILPKITVLTVAGASSFTTSAGCKNIKVEIVGGGGAGGSSTAGVSSMGGSAGGYARGYFAPGTYTYTIGVAGARSLSAGTNGGSGGTTLWSSAANLMSAAGGGGGLAGNGTNNVGGTVSGAGVLFYCYGGTGGAGTPGSWYSGRGGTSFFGGGGANCYDSSLSISANGNNGAAFGSGGAGGIGGTGLGGNGATAAIIITEYF